MADILKYVSLANLTKYDEKIKEHIASADATLKTDLEGQVNVVAGALDSEIARAKAAEQTNATAAQNAQTAADNLAGKVGTVPNDKTVMGIIEQIQADAYDDSEIRGLISGLDTNKADKTQVATDIAAAVKVETDARVEAVAGVQGAIDTLSGTHATDKKALEDAVALKADQTALDAEVQRATQAEAGLQTQINTIMNNPDAEGAINSINEFTQYVADHGTIADGFRTDINKNKDDIAALDTAYKAADTAIQGRLDNLEAIDHEAYKAADTALKNELEGKINAKADASALTSAVEALEGADEELSGRLDDVEAALGTGEGSVSAQIATSKQEAIDAAAADATTKANAAETAAKGHADSLNTAMDERMDLVEAKAHEHSNKALLDTYTQTEANLADAVAKKHAHSNLEVLEGITSAKVAAWDAAESNAKTYAKDYADGLNTSMAARMDAVELWQENMVECTEDDINSLFTA